MRKTAKGLLVCAPLGVYTVAKFGVFVWLALTGRWLELALLLLLLLVVFLVFLGVGVYTIGYLYRQAADKGERDERKSNKKIFDECSSRASFGPRSS